MTLEQIEDEWRTWACTILATDKWELLFGFAQHIAMLERDALIAKLETITLRFNYPSEQKEYESILAKYKGAK